MSAQKNAITLKVLNNSNQKPVVYIGKAATLDITLDNNTDGPITLTSGKNNPATLLILLPEFYTDADYTKMDIQLKDWTLQKYQANDLSLTLVYTGSTDGSWTTTTPLSFKITGAQSDASATNGQSQINPSGLKGNNIPIEIVSSSNLTLEKAPSGAKPDLPIDLSLNNNKIFISDKANSIDNSLILNFKNTGSTAIYTGTKARPQTANVIVKFTYGSVAGALAPDNDKASPQLGSAWNIEGKVAISGGNDWTVSNPSSTGQQDAPQWNLKPSSTNQGIIGVDVNSNITFNFSKIVSLLIPGHTQMTIQFSDFPFNDTIDYNDKTFTLDIVKEKPIPGILKFTSIGPSILSYEPGKATSNGTATLSWLTQNVDYVTLSWLGHCGDPVTLDSRKTSNPNPCDSSTPFSQIKVNESSFEVDLCQSFPNSVIFTLKAFNSSGKQIGSEQQLTFQFEKVISLISISISPMAGINGNNEIEIQSSPRQLINEQYILLPGGAQILPCHTEQQGNVQIDQYSLKDFGLDDTIDLSNYLTYFDTWKVVINKDTDNTYPFKGQIKMNPISDLSGIKMIVTSNLFIGIADGKFQTQIRPNTNSTSTANIWCLGSYDETTHHSSWFGLKHTTTVTKVPFSRNFPSAPFLISDIFKLSVTQSPAGYGFYSILKYDFTFSLTLEKTKATYNVTGVFNGVPLTGNPIGVGLYLN